MRVRGFQHFASVAPEMPNDKSGSVLSCYWSSSRPAVGGRSQRRGREAIGDRLGLFRRLRVRVRGLTLTLHSHGVPLAALPETPQTFAAARTADRTACGDRLHGHACRSPSSSSNAMEAGGW